MGARTYVRDSFPKKLPYQKTVSTTKNVRKKKQQHLLLCFRFKTPNNIFYPDQSENYCGHKRPLSLSFTFRYEHAKKKRHKWHESRLRQNLPYTLGAEHHRTLDFERAGGAGSVAHSLDFQQLAWGLHNAHACMHSPLYNATPMPAIFVSSLKHPMSWCIIINSFLRRSSPPPPPRHLPSSRKNPSLQHTEKISDGVGRNGFEDQVVQKPF